MNYTRSLKFLDSFLDLERLSRWPENAFFNLRRMEHLLRVAGHPEKGFFPILIAGTTGKGSTGFFLESILQANGIRTGFYHSPHVDDPRERIRLQGRQASREMWAEGLTEVRRMLRESPVPRAYGPLTYFEVLTLLAILIFSKHNVCAGIFEVGLGGRLDATNVLKAPLVVLTPIHFDHEAFLGNTLRKIAKEKAGIIKGGNHAVTGHQPPEAFRAIRAAVTKQKGFLWRASAVHGIPLGLAGDFQRKNAGTALKAAAVLKEHFGFPITQGRLVEGLRAGAWQGRMEYLRRRGRTFLLDGAHNPISVRQLVVELCRRPEMKNAWLIFGAMQDKDTRTMLETLSRFFATVILVRAGNRRAKTLGQLLAESKGLFKRILPVQNTREAIDRMTKIPGPKVPAVVTGSFYLVGEARKLLKGRR